MKGDKMTGVSCADNCDLYEDGYKAGKIDGKWTMWEIMANVCEHRAGDTCMHISPDVSCRYDRCPLIREG